MDELQTDLDQWIDLYNNKRTHPWKMCRGRTPVQTLQDGIHLLNEKVDASTNLTND